MTVQTKMIASGLAILMGIVPLSDVAALAVGAVPAGQAGTEQKPTLKERILEIPSGTMVEVRLLNKQKIRGRLGEITNEGFSLQTAQGDKVETQKIAFTDAKSVKKVEGGKAGHAVLYALAGIGALFVGLIIWWASLSD